IETAGIERDALADHGDAAPHPSLGHVGQVDELGRLLAPLRHPEVGPHRELRAVVALQALEGETTARFRDLPCALGVIASGDVVGRLVDEIASQTRALRPQSTQPQPLASGRAVAGVWLDDAEALDDLVALFLEVAVEPVRPERRAFDDRS